MLPDDLPTKIYGDGTKYDTAKIKHDVDLGDGHWLDWSEYKGQRCGGIITHRSAKTESGFCSGCFWTDRRFFEDCGKNGAVWSFDGNAERPTLNPSFLCHCGDHGFIRAGKWVRA